MFILGTRPEVIKLAPLIKVARTYGLKTTTVHTGQHSDLAADAFRTFKLKPDLKLKVMSPNQSLSRLTQKLISKTEKVVSLLKPDMIIVQGDTTSVLVGALIAFYHQIPIAHIEAGLRTQNKREPFPEEINRRLVSHLSDLHFCPTQLAAENLISEGVSKKNIFIVGNTGIDAQQYILRNQKTSQLVKQLLKKKKKLILLTTHRRENFGQPLINICTGIKKIIRNHKDLIIVCPIHPNPNVSLVIRKRLKHPRIVLTDPLNFTALTQLLDNTYLVITDSGGLQEEAPSLGKPVVILRNTTERPEVVANKIGFLAGTDPDKIFEITNKLLRDKIFYKKTAVKKMLFGDGTTSEKIVKQILKYI